MPAFNSCQVSVEFVVKVLHELEYLYLLHKVQDALKRNICGFLVMVVGGELHIIRAQF